ncbi:Ribosomal protein L11/L12 like protein [Aduncisulcus paluster]|uniref:Ribosomal protein L11/L12 like protein n=1 Tax=Aduncisulcus paluster TaxID=2918883 RepID=A0ABQ5KJZ3_9EUKA|nr:Ribosomal protein L11/L12 like protein [Aduncisulcus paluster]|eukprot:gnl/Carplike_NY0171/82_a111_7304.p1 GENE.gnl/Carplike_NY0171/82_a111_7304~~gnl/Carplike_NY0171/82_a111_7304.p1  ORF type:complete len:168 (+),score=73.49 gnl/Carplike_NY0171/82_a111_7304:102-605(+)
MPAKKFDPNEETIVYLVVKGGKPPASQVLAPKVGRLGVNPNAIAKQVAAETQGWKGLTVTVELKIKCRKATMNVVPSTAGLVISRIKEGARTKDTPHAGPIAWSDVVDIARGLLEKNKTLSKDVAAACREVIGTVRSVGGHIEYEGEAISCEEMTEMIKDKKVPIAE